MPAARSCSQVATIPKASPATLCVMAAWRSAAAALRATW